jgi:hypothetical protein
MPFFMIRRSTVLVMLLFLPFLQNAAAEAPLFPISPLVEAYRSGGISWRPDWPPEVPADAFLVSGDWSVITLSSASRTYTLSRNGGGRLSSFPFFADGKFVQVHTRFDPQGGLSGFTVEEHAEGEFSGDAEDAARNESSGDNRDAPAGTGTSPEPSSWEIDFLAFDGPLPLSARINMGGVYAFAVFRHTDALVIETWYDGNGAALAVFSFTFQQEEGKRRLVRAEQRSDAGEFFTEYHYDSLGNISGIYSPLGTWSAQYVRRFFPRYVEIAPGAESGGRLTLQWDERGLLVRLTGGEELDMRYEYSLDERGNWKERRELSMVRRFGYILPASETVLSREIEYGAGE